MYDWPSAKADIYFSPWVMRAAWNKTLNWYSTGEWVDPAELLAWKAELWRHLADLAADLSAGTYKPFPFPEIPYPKKGSLTRHYVIPSVRDQVAFMTFLVLLGPFLEARMPNVSFGNRLFRARVLMRPAGSNNGAKKWFTAPFSLADRRVYTGFPSSYGLFRRLLQWLVNACILGPKTADLPENESLATEDPDRLPYWDYIKDDVEATDLLHARLDMRMTYPSLERAVLNDVLMNLLSDQVGGGLRCGDASEDSYVGMGRPDFPSMYSDSKGFSNWIEPRHKHGAQHPWGSLSSNEGDRLQLVAQMMEALNAVQYTPWKVPSGWEDNVNSLYPCSKCENRESCAEKADSKDHWVGPHGYAPLVSGQSGDSEIVNRRDGLPTGLAISGLLLNAALTPADEVMVGLWRKAASEKGRFFYLRFVDDVVILADTADRLEAGIRALSDTAQKCAGSKVTLNTSKAKPEGVRAFLTKNKGGERPLSSFVSYQDYLTRSNLELFTTSVVREMSGLAEESLDERYGAPGVERLEHLMELATLDIDDFEVGADARLSFAVNKIASASWPRGDVVCDDTVISEKAFRQKIYHIAEMALRRHPWRFKLWRPILAIAIRGSIRDGSGLRWLKESVLPLISWPSGSIQRPSTLTWEELDARQCEDRCRHQGCSHQAELLETVRHRSRERCSYHRAEFFRQLSNCLATLQRLAEPDGTRVSSGWASHVTPEDARQLLGAFGDVQQFCDIVYRGWKWSWREEPFIWWWESEALALAALTSSSPSHYLLGSLPPPGPQQLRRSDGLGGILLAQIVSRRRKRTRFPLFPVSIMDDGLTKPEDFIRVHPGAWLTQYFGRWDEKKTELAWAMLPSLPDPAWSALSRLSDWGYLHGVLARAGWMPWPPPAPSYSSGLWRDFILATDYAALRRLMLAHGANPVLSDFPSWFAPISAMIAPPDRDSRHSLHRAMYCFGDETRGFPDPAAAPAIGLNWQIAWSVMESLNRVMKGGDLVCPSTVILTRSEHDWIVKTRLSGLIDGDRREFCKPAFEEGGTQMISTLGADHPAPHPLFLLTRNMCGGDELEISSYQRGALLLWMLCGHEALLDDVFESFPWRLPFTERASIRARYLVPDPIWYLLEANLGMSSLNWPDRIQCALEEYAESGHLELPRDPWVSHITMDSQGDWTVGRPEPGSNDSRPIRELHVRIVQPVERADFFLWKPSRGRPFFLESASTMGGVPEELASRLHEAWSESRINCGSTDETSKGVREHLIMFPEWYADSSSVRGLVKFCRDTGIAILCGMLPRELPRAVPVVAPLRRKGLRCIVNEAVLVIPAYEKATDKGLFTLPSQVYEFRIRKCMPNVSEVALTRHLEESIPDTKWRFAGGDSWFCLHHPAWGAFCVTICSDVLTTGKWRDLYGTIQHLLIPARNLDVDLFDQVSWTRGYELYANAITVNHGDYGGSAVWTPKHSHGREVFHVRGQKKGVAVVVGVPVASLIEAQERQFEKSACRSKDWWSGRIKDKKESDEFKTPPPRVVHRNGQEEFRS